MQVSNRHSEPVNNINTCLSAIKYTYTPRIESDINTLRMHIQASVGTDYRQRHEHIRSALGSIERIAAALQAHTSSMGVWAEAVARLLQHLVEENESLQYQLDTHISEGR